MSYCRMSTDDGKSDVYCLRHMQGGYTTFLCDSPRAAIEYYDETLNEFHLRLVLLQVRGYHIPNCVFDRIAKELLEELN